MGSSFSRNEGSYSEAELVAGLKENKFKNIVIMCGAGISTNAGIPDFRSPSAGLYFKLRKYNLPYPEAVFEGSYFRQDPKPFYGLIREMFPEALAPTDTHKFFSLLHQKGLLRRIYTQNIDALEYLAGVPQEKVVEAHGSFQSSYCTKCKEEYDLKWLKDEIFSPEKNEEVPKCVKCQGVVRPNVVLFGEALPNRFWVNITPDFEQCDLLIVLGTSLVVSPFNSLVGKPHSSVPRIYISKTKPGSSGSVVGWFLSMSANVDFSRQSDLMMMGDCDDIVHRITKELGWEAELSQVDFQTLDALTK